MLLDPMGIQISAPGNKEHANFGLQELIHLDRWSQDLFPEKHFCNIPQPFGCKKTYC